MDTLPLPTRIASAIYVQLPALPDFEQWRIKGGWMYTGTARYYSYQERCYKTVMELYEKFKNNNQ